MNINLPRVLGCVVMLPLIGIPASAMAQGKSSSQDLTLVAADGWPVHITYYESRGGGKESPAVILLPGAEGRDAGSMTRKVWEDTAKTLQRDGFAVVTVDLRKHGDSVPEGDVISESRLNRLLPADYQAMVLADLEAVKAFLLEEHQKQKLNIRKLGIAAAGSSCLVAAAFAVNDWSKKPWPDAAAIAARTPRGQDVRAILMLSPKSSVKGLNMLRTMRAISAIVPPIALHVYYSAEDRTEKRDAEQLYRFVELDAEGSEEFRRLIPGPASAEGFLKLRGPQGENVMDRNIADFFKHNLSELQDPWRSRTSRLLE